MIEACEHGTSQMWNLQGGKNRRQFDTAPKRQTQRGSERMSGRIDKPFGGRQRGSTPDQARNESPENNAHHPKVPRCTQSLQIELSKL